MMSYMGLSRLQQTNNTLNFPAPNILAKIISASNILAKIISCILENSRLKNSTRCTKERAVRYTVMTIAQIQVRDNGERMRKSASRHKPNARGFLSINVSPHRWQPIGTGHTSPATNRERNADKCDSKSRRRIVVGECFLDRDIWTSRNPPVPVSAHGYANRLLTGRVCSSSVKINLVMQLIAGTFWRCCQTEGNCCVRKQWQKKGPASQPYPQAATSHLAAVVVNPSIGECFVINALFTLKTSAFVYIVDSKIIDKSSHKKKYFSEKNKSDLQLIRQFVQSNFSLNH